MLLIFVPAISHINQLLHTHKSKVSLVNSVIMKCIKKLIYTCTPAQLTEINSCIHGPLVVLLISLNNEKQHYTHDFIWWT